MSHSVTILVSQNKNVAGHDITLNFFIQNCRSIKVDLEEAAYMYSHNTCMILLKVDLHGFVNLSTKRY